MAARTLQVILGVATCGLGLAMVMAVFLPPLTADAGSPARLVQVPATGPPDLEPHRSMARTSELPVGQPVAGPSSPWRSARIPSVDAADSTQTPPHRRGVAQVPQGRIDKADLRSELLRLATAQRRVTLEWSSGYHATSTLDPVTMWRTRWFVDQQRSSLGPIR